LTAQVYSDSFFQFFGDWINDAENSSKVVDKNGQPLVVYHSTWAWNLTEFSHDDIEAMKFDESLRGYHFFTENIKQSKMFGNFTLPTFLNISNPSFETGAFSVFNSKTGKFEKTWSLNKNSDGFIAFDNQKALLLKDEKANEYVVLNSNQIKSATENIGTFSAKTPDIRYSIANQSEENIIRRSDLTPIADQTVADIVEYNQFYKSKELLEKGTKRTKPKQFVENSKFNNTENPILTLANPSEILLSVGIPNLPISVPFKYFQEHLIENRDHEIAASEISEIMRGIHNPLAIYKNTERQEYTRTNRY